MNPVGAQEERRVGVGGLVGRGAVDNLAVRELLVGEEVASADAEAHGRRKIDARSEFTAVALVGALLTRRVENEVPQHLARGLQAGRVGVDRYRVTQLIRNSAHLGPYSRTMPRLLWRS